MTAGTSRRLARGAVPQGRRGVSIGGDPARPVAETPGDDDTEPILPIRERLVPGLAEGGRNGRRRRPPARAVMLGAALIAGIGSAGYLLVSQRSGVQPAAGAHHSAPHRASHASHAAPAVTHTTTAPSAAASRVLTPASASAIGFAGRPGDNSDLAKLAIDRKPSTAWRTDWYTTARFGNLYPGTGLLLDMGRPVTITAVRITLNRARGAGLQVRVGSVPTLSSLRLIARAANASGVVHLRPPQPALGRYVLIWFTRLPPDPAGTFEERVSSILVNGRS